MAIASNFGSTRPSLLLDFANVGRLDPRVTFTRASSGTFYDGVTTAKAEENLLQYSQEFDNAYWNKLRATATANADTAPDGTATADAVLQASGETTAGQAQRASFPVVAGDYVISIFAKPNGKNFLRILESLSDGTNNTTWFNVSTGAVGTNDAGHTATITASTNSYYRCTIKFTVNAARSGTVLFGLADTDNSTVVADDTNGLYLWGAQLEQRSAVSSYTPTTTQPITNYIPVLQTAASGVARFDHNPTTGEALGLLIEEQRTNLCLQSEDFSTTWANTNSAEEVNIIVAPDGTLTGDKLIPDTVSAAHSVNQSISVTSGTTYTFTVYAKAGEYYGAGILFASAGFGTNSVDTFNLSTGTVVTNATGNATITNVGNGWYRISSTRTASATASSAFQIRAYPAESSASYSGDDYSGIFIWGADLEEGAFPTSYIPTTTASVTRNADAASMVGTNFSSWYNAGEGTVYGEWNSVGSLSDSRIVYAISDGTFNNTNYLVAAVAVSSNQTSLAIRSSAVTSANITVTGAYTNYAYRKTAVGYKVNDFGISGDGAAANTDTSGAVPLGVDRLFIGASWVGTTNFLGGTIKKIAFYPQRLSDAQLQALTG